MIKFLIKQKRKISFLLAFAIFINCIPVYALDGNSTVGSSSRRSSSSAEDSSSRSSDENDPSQAEQPGSENDDDNSSSEDEKDTADEETKDTENVDDNDDEVNSEENEIGGGTATQDGDTADSANTNGYLSLDDIKNGTDLGITVNNTSINITSGNGLILLSNVDPAEYANSKIEFGTNNSLDLTGTATLNGKEYTFQGLGNDDKPFAGTLEMTMNVSGVYIKADRSFFNCVSDSAELTINLIAYKNTEDGEPLLAKSVKHIDSDSTKKWIVNIKTERQGDSNSSQSQAAAGVIGTLLGGAKIDITVNVSKGTNKDGNDILPISSGNGYRGAICNEMEANSSLTFNYTENSLYDVKSANSNAGGIVGHMASGATLTINNARTLNQTVTATKDSAGGIVGSAEDINPITVSDGSTVTVNSNLIGGNAGGYIGSYIAKTANNNFTPDLSKITLNSTLQGTNVGGVFGMLDIKTGATVTLRGTSTDSTDTNTSDTSYTITSTLSQRPTNYGGIVGQLTGENLSSSFIVENLKVKTNLSKQKVVSNIGGIAGETSGNLYFKVDEVNIEVVSGNTGNYSTSSGNSGGVMGQAKGYPMVDIGSVSLNGPYGSYKSSNAETLSGGLIGCIEGGVVRLSGTTDMTNAEPKREHYQIAQLVGQRNSALVYAEKNWIFIRQPIQFTNNQNRLSDIGDWGEVVRLSGFDENDRPVTYNETAHQVTLKQIDTSGIATKGDFAALAIAMSCYNFGGALANQNNFTNAASLYSSTINITDDINMSGTGVYSLMRDATATKNSFRGTVNGNGKTVTLICGETYGYRGDSSASGNGSGQIYDHSNIGMLTNVTNGTNINNITIAGELNYNQPSMSRVIASPVCSTISPSQIDKNQWISFTNVTVNTTVTRNGKNETMVGGFVGYISNAQLKFEKCNMAGNINITGSDKSYIGGYVGYVSTEGSFNIADSSIGNGSNININSSNSIDAYLGGFIAYISDGKRRTININNFTVDVFTATANASGTAGGFLGYKWDNATVTFGDGINSGVTVKNSSLNYAGDATFGGMVTVGAGYWKVNKNGIVYDSGVKFTGGSNTDTPTGFIVSNGVPDTERALYLEILPNGYDIKTSSITANLNGATIADEICGKSIRDNAGSNNAVISIATDESHSKIDENSCNTYQNKILDPSVVNSHTRYYYNLDYIRTENSPRAKLMRTSLFYYRATNIQNYFKDNGANGIFSADNPIKNGDNGEEIDLTGYSYYPVSMNVPIEGATITFDNKGICEKEDTNGNKNKCPTDPNINQHYLMHCGVYYNVGSGLTVNNLTLQGTVGRTSDGNSGALVYGVISGGQGSISTISLNSITLDGITVYNRHAHSDLSSDDYAPLLINKISDYVTLDVTGVTQTNRYVVDNKTAVAASSLIGGVGSTGGTNIRLSFSDIQLDARQNENTPQYTDDTRYSGTTKTIFTRATLLNSFSYSDVTSCYGRYNFSNDSCTYGYEIGNGDTDVGGRNPNNQMWYYGQNGTDRGLIKDDNTIIYDGENNKNYTNYIRYVYTPENATNSRYELDINQMSVSILEGCGTYSDPYIITDGNQLRAIAKYLNGTAQNGLGLTFDSHVLDISYDDNTTAHTKGNGSDKHVMYIYENKTWYEAEYNSDRGEYIKKNPEEIFDGNSKILAYLRNAYYLIQPTSDDYSITMPSDFTGLGGLTYTGNDITVFSGAVIGAADENGKYPTIKITTNNGTDTDTSKINQFGGVVRTSAGAVVKDLIVDYSGANITLTPSSHDFDNGSPNTLVQDQGVFGGVVGYCTAGDTIVDNVTVTGFKNSNNTASGSVSVTEHNKHMPIGGYVGLVGGSVGYTGGGVVFKNINTDNVQLFDSVSYTDLGAVSVTTGNTNNTGDGTFYYLNPYVGRVLDGYAASEGEKCTLDNTDKNYKIPNLSAEKVNNTLYYADGTITLNSAQQLWLLGAIVNSGAGSYNGTTYNIADGVYVRGRTRTADYDKVGQLENNQNPNRADDAHWGGVTDKDRSTKYSYLVRHYASENARTICNNAVTITLGDDINMSSYDGTFRSIGTNYTWFGDKVDNEYKTNNDEKHYLSRTIKLQGFDGNYKTLTLNSSIKSYYDESWLPHRMGLFSTINILDNIEVKNLTIRGLVELDAVISNTENTERTDMMVGGFAGTTVGTGGKTITFNNVNLGGDLKDGETTAFVVNHVGKIESCKDRYGTNSNRTATGGFVGGLWEIETNMNFNDCSYNNISVKGPGIVGGLVGRVWQKKSTINIKRADKLADDKYDFANSIIYSLFANDRIDRSDIIGGDVNQDIYGIGGLVGYTASPIYVTNVRIQNIEINACGNLNDGKSASALDAGGLVGYINNKTAGYTASIDNVDIVNVDIVGGYRTGGIFGMINGQNVGSTEIKNCSIDKLNILDKGDSSVSGALVGTVWEPLNIDSVSVKNSKIISKRDAGGLAGDLGSRDSLSIKNVTIENNIIACVRSGGSPGGAGGIVGTTGTSSVVIYGYNILMKDTAVGYWLNSNGDGVYPNPTIENVKNNIKLPKDPDNGTSNAETLDDQIGLYSGGYKKYGNITYTKDDFGEKSYAGVWFGAEDTSGAVKLIAVQTKDCYLPLRMYGNKANADLADNDVIIYADYNVTDGAAGLATNPTTQVNISDGITLSSDGAAFKPESDGTSSTTPILSQILGELTDTAINRPRYSNMLTIAADFKDGTSWKAEENTSSDTTFVTTFGGAQNIDIANNQNFPVVIVSPQKSVDLQIKTALSLLTNSDQTKTPLFDKDSVTVTTYKYENGSFSAVTDDNGNANPSVKYNDSTKTFSTNGSNYDNGKAQFTLITVKYTSGTGTSDDYTLYLPIILKKTLDYTFTSRIENGTNYWTDNYPDTDTNKSLLSGHGEKNTALLTFTYEPSSADWVRMLNNGERFNWGLTKTVTLQTVSNNTFPVGTEFVLVDRTNGGKAYYYTLTQEDIGGATSSGSQKNYEFSFEKFKSRDDKEWSPTNLTDQMDITMKEDSSGGYIEATDNDRNAIKAGDKYYKYDTESSDSDVQRYSIESVVYKNNSGTDGKLKEEYYLTIKTPADTQGYVNGNINRGTATAKDGTMAVNRLKIEKVSGYIIGSFFAQELSVSSEGEVIEQLSEDNNIIHANLEQTIKFAEGADQTTFAGFTEGKSLYQGFSVWLNQSVGGNLSTVDFPAGTKAKVTYKLYKSDGTKIDNYDKTVEYDDIASNTVLMYPDSIRNLLANTEYSDGIIVKASVDFVLSVDGLSRIPKREGTGSTDGVQVVAKVMLSYTEYNILSSQTATDSVTDKTATYYTQGISSTSLVYSVDDVSRRGANGIVDGNLWPVDSTAYYDVSEFKDVATAAKIKAVISLSVKNNNGEYVAINDDLSKYLSDCKISGNALPSDSGKTTYEVTYDWVGKDYAMGDQIKIPVSFKISTGTEFEENNLTYANYKVTLTVSLLDADGKELEGSGASDYIIYTNAKVLTDVIQNDSNG